MSDELEALNRIVVAPPVVVEVNGLPGVEKPLPTPEEARMASEALSRDQESDAVVSLLGLWTCGNLLHDIVTDTFAAGSDEDEDQAARKKKKPDPGCGCE